MRLARRLPWISFPSVHSLVTLGVQFKDSCRRLWCIVAAEGGLYPKCVHCKVIFLLLFLHPTVFVQNYLCHHSCLEEWSSKIVLDIGGKWTWLVNARIGLKKHRSMIAVPKLLRCYDCDSFIDRRRTQAHCDCHACPDSASLAPGPRLGSDLYCRHGAIFFPR